MTRVFSKILRFDVLNIHGDADLAINLKIYKNIVKKVFRRGR